MGTFDWNQIRRQIDQAMLADRFRLRRRLKAVQEDARQDRPIADELADIQARIQQSRDRVAQRQRQAPQLEFSELLPISAKRLEIAEAVNRHQVLVVCGETGSGKSTQLPKICLEAGRGIFGMIGHTQPRRIAARTIASRLADEIHTSVGAGVGFKIRFTDRTDPLTYVKLMTDGIMLSETRGDRFLEQYDTIILDEAHERSLNIDFLLGYIQRLLPQRPELRLIITSATIDAERFAEHFTIDQRPAPIIEVSGRTFPVDVLYRPIEGADDEGNEIDESDAVLDAVSEAAGLGPGDILVFFPTERDIRDAAKRLRGAQKLGRIPPQSEILPLYARLSNAEQNKVFAPHGKRRIVLATNVAESSLTVPGIRYVVDLGTARISRYSARSKVQRLPIEPVSRASADQRKGRCGRIGPGVCLRLYGEEDFNNRDHYTTPAIRRTNLASVILQTKALRLGSIEEFPFLDPPRAESIRDGYKTLIEIGALDNKRQLTKIGRRLSELPVNPRIGRMILAGESENCLAEVLIIATALEIQDPRDRPAEKQKAADEAHAKFADEGSDFYTYLTIWDAFHQWKSDLSKGQLRKACRQNFLSFLRMREWLDVHRQLKQLVSGRGMKIPPRRDDRDAIHRALLPGLLSNIAFRAEQNEYTGSGGNKFVLWPGSGVFSTRPKWVVAGELVETSRRFLRNVASINPDWIEPLAEHLVKRNHDDPFWSSKRSTAMTYERVTLFGLPIVARRAVPLAPLDRETARHLFIEHALVGFDMPPVGRFLDRNRQVLEEIGQLGAKLRRGDFAVDEYTQFQFYQQRLPDHVCDRRGLQQWLKENKSHDQQLTWTRQDLLNEENDGGDTASYPDSLPTNEVRLPLSYRFEPGSDQDGVTVTVPVDGLGQISPESLGWIVPGLIEEKIIALIRSLPKQIRRSLVPAPDTARMVAERIEYGQGSFLQAVAGQLSAVAEQPIDLAEFRLNKLSPHLQLNVRAVDQKGEVLAEGRDLAEIRRVLGGDDRHPSAEIADADWTRDGLTTWDFDELPRRVDRSVGGLPVAAFPALVDRGDSVDMRLLDSRPLADQQTAFAIRRLFVLHQKRSLAEQVAWLPKLQEMKLFSNGLLSAKQLEEQLAVLIADRALLLEQSLPRDKADFEARVAVAADRLLMAVRDVAKFAVSFFEAFHEARLALENTKGDRWADIRGDVRGQLKQLTSENFLVRTPWLWLQHLPRYVKGVRYRLDKLQSGSADRDNENYQIVRECCQRYEQARQQQLDLGISFDDELFTYRWMIEELRISLFAQPLGTAFSISPQRMAKQWSKIRGDL